MTQAVPWTSWEALVATSPFFQPTDSPLFFFFFAEAEPRLQRSSAAKSQLQPSDPSVRFNNERPYEATFSGCPYPERTLGRWWMANIWSAVCYGVAGGTYILTKLRRKESNIHDMQHGSILSCCIFRVKITWWNIKFTVFTTANYKRWRVFCSAQRFHQPSSAQQLNALRFQH